MRLIKINESNYLNVEGLREVILRPDKDNGKWACVYAVYADNTLHWLRSFSLAKDDSGLLESVIPEFEKYVAKLNESAEEFKCE